MTVLPAFRPRPGPFPTISAKFQPPTLLFSLLWLGWVSWWPPWVRREPFCPASGGLLAIFGNLAHVAAMFDFVVCHLSTITWLLIAGRRTDC